MIAIVALPVDWKGAATIVQRLADLPRSAWLVNALALLLKTHFREAFGEANIIRRKCNGRTADK